jgi:quinol monooxygenase YgiN
MVAKPGRGDEVLELLLENPRRIEEGEPGNLAFGVDRSTEKPEEFWLYETWESEDAVNAHESGEAFTGRERVSLSRLRTTRSAEPIQASGADTMVRQCVSGQGSAGG